MASPRILPLNPGGAATARAGDCMNAQGRLYCLPALINIGVQKAGTGELQTWLGAHPNVLVHGGEVHFFDSLRASCRNKRQQSALRMRYARYLWKRKELDEGMVSGRITFEKTPAYFDMAEPQLIACAVPDVRLLLMLRMPVSRAISAYRMCQEELSAKWCRRSFDEIIAHALPEGSGTRINPALQEQVRRLLMMGQYASHLHRWLLHFTPEQLRILWVEQFKQDPFACLEAVQQYARLPSFNYRRIATRNDAGLWVVGKSKSSGGHAGSGRTLSPGSNATLHRFYEPSQRRLRALISQANLTLVSDPSPPFGSY